MNRIRLSRPLARALVATLLALALLGVATAQQDAQQLTVLVLSEQHGAVFADDEGIGGLAQVGTLVDQVRAETDGAVLVVSSGDILIGTVMSSAFRGRADIEAMNLIGVDALTLGNHEFDFGIAYMDELEELAEFPFLTTNVMGVQDLGVETALIRDIGGLRVGVLGVTNPGLQTSTSSETEVLTVVPTLDIMQRAVEILDPVTDVIVVVTHQTTREDLELLAAVEGIDLIAGGHTTGFDGMYLAGAEFDPALPQGRFEVENPPGVYVKPRGATTEVGRVDLFVEDGEVVRALAENIVVQGFEEDPDVTELLAGYEAQLSERLGEVVAVSEVPLDGDRADVRTRETNLGNLIADGLLAQFPEADIAFANGGGIRTPLEAGEITLGDVLEVHPFGNTIVTFDLTGAQVLEALENGVSAVADGAGRYLQVAGLSFVWDPNADPGSRVVSVTVGDEALDEGAMYTIVTNNFIAGGGDDFEVFTRGQNFYDSQQVDADVLASYLRALGTVAPEVEGRITTVQ